MPNLGGWEILIPLALIAGLFIGALVSMAKHPAASGTMKALWVLIILLFPIFGPILWFVIGKNSSTQSPA